MLTWLDWTVLVVYIVGVAVFGIRAGGKQRSATDYFLGGRDLPWWAVCFSVVATETSTLTVLGVPAVAYFGSLTFLQIAFGYLAGRVVVSLFFLPRYYKGNLSTAYAFLGDRFGDSMRATASVTFLLTRLLADGVRLFATAIPLKVIADSVGLETSYLAIITAIGVVTIVYTLVGGIKAVVWMDVVQMLLYIGGAVLALWFLAGAVPEGWWADAAAAGKTQLFNLAVEPWNPSATLTFWLTQPYALVTAIVGGALFSLASHGTDQLIVQRLLACRTLGDGQKALIGSGVVVLVQFALFLFVGLLLWAYYGGASLQELGAGRGDEIFPRYIIEGMPPGISGLLLAGIVAAAMSTLSSSLNALASSTLYDLYERIRGKRLDLDALRLSRIFTFVWGLVFIVFAAQFQDTENTVVELGLAIAGFTYGGLLGAFLLGLLTRKTRQLDAIVAFAVTVAFMTWMITSLWHVPGLGWEVAFYPPGSDRPEAFQAIAWPLYPLIGGLVTLLVGSLLSLRH